MGDVPAHGERFRAHRQPSPISEPAGDLPIVLALLRQLCTAPGHHFWTEDLSIREILVADAIIAHSQITDVYLLGLAGHKGGKLASLDQHIPLDAVRDGRDALELLTV